jgi:hypothetical protein
VDNRASLATDALKVSIGSQAVLSAHGNAGRISLYAQAMAAFEAPRL